MPDISPNGRRWPAWYRLGLDVKITVSPDWAVDVPPPPRRPGHYRHGRIAAAIARFKVSGSMLSYPQDFLTFLPMVGVF